MTAKIQTYIVAFGIAVLFGVSILISTSMTTIPVSAQVEQETANKQLDQAIKALDSGDNAAAEGYMKEADKALPEGEAKMHLGEAMKALQSGDVEGATMHTQLAQGSL
jgi:cellobiose-specific phosphotransferase system component IIA